MKFRALFPNQFVNARLLIETLHGVLIMPGAAVQQGEPGTFVYLIRSDGIVHLQPVELGPGDNDAVDVQSGLNEGDRVVTDGADRLREGARVVIPPANGEARGAVTSELAPAAPGSVGRPRGSRAVAGAEWTGMRCVECGFTAVTERPERTAHGYKRFRCRG